MNEKYGKGQTGQKQCPICDKGLDRKANKCWSYIWLKCLTTHFERKWHSQKRTRFPIMVKAFQRHSWLPNVAWPHIALYGHSQSLGYQQTFPYMGITMRGNHCETRDLRRSHQQCWIIAQCFLPTVKYILGQAVCWPYISQTEELLPGRQANKLKMDSLKSATLTKADGSTVDAATALQQKVLIIEIKALAAFLTHLWKLSWLLRMSLI